MIKCGITGSSGVLGRRIIKLLPYKFYKFTEDITDINEVKKWGINEAKWKAAEEYCEIKGWKWQIMTEDTLNTTK